MSKAFGTMPADRELAAFGSAFGGLLLGAVTADVVAAVIRGSRPGAGPGGMAFLHVLLAALAAVFVTQVSSWALRVALAGFSLNQVLSVGWVATALPTPWWTSTALYALVACGLLVSAWPRASGWARTTTLLLFAAAVCVKVLLTSAL